MFLLFFDDCFFEPNELVLCFGFAQLGIFAQGASPVILSILFWGFSGLVAFFFFFSSSSSSSGWVGSPCRVFPAFSPWFSGGWGVRFVFFALHSSILLLLCRSRLGQPGVRARKPPGPHRACTLLVSPDLSPAGSRRGDEQSTSAVG